MKMSFPNLLGEHDQQMVNSRDQRQHRNGVSDEKRLHLPKLGCVPPLPARVRPYLIAASCLLSCLQASIHTDDADFGSSLGGEAVTLHEIHDHHMVFQLGAECFDLKSPGHSRFRVAASGPLLTSFCRNSGVLHDTRNLVTSASEPGRHNFLC